jgi:hypothetical protein
MSTENKITITRRDFLKLSALYGLGSFISPFEQIDKTIFSSSERNFKYIEAKTIVANKAASYAKDFFGNMPYRFGKADCAIFAGQFASYFGIQIKRDATDASLYKPSPKEPLTNATTIKQVAWFKALDNSLGGGYITEPQTTEIANEDYWQDVSPGSLVYLRTEGYGQHGFNEYSHVAVFLGFDEKGKTIFGEYTPGMEKGPEINRSLNQVLRMYYGKLPTGLSATIINLSEMAPKIWKEKSEKVVPNSEMLIKAGYKQILSVNLNNGLSTYWEIDTNDKPQQKKFANGNYELYSVVGRSLLPRSTLTEKYNSMVEAYKKYQPYRFLRYSSYDATSGVLWGTPLKVPRYYLTPPLIFELSQFALAGNFGKLGGYTDIAIMHVLAENYGSLTKVDEISNYTIHATPQNTKSLQEILLRDKYLNKANGENKPLPYEYAHLTSGCINFTPEVFETIKKTLNGGVNKTAVIFSYPDFPQDQQLENQNFTYKYDPLGGPMIKIWGYNEL